MTLTSEVLGMMAVALILYDIWTALQHGASSTISWTTYTLAQKYPVVAFGVGIVMGHVFWVQKGG